jgi:hypothetical protein
LFPIQQLSTSGSAGDETIRFEAIKRMSHGGFSSTCQACKFPHGYVQQYWFGENCKQDPVSWGTHSASATRLPDRPTSLDERDVILSDRHMTVSGFIHIADPPFDQKLCHLWWDIRRKQHPLSRRGISMCSGEQVQGGFMGQRCHLELEQEPVLPAGGTQYYLSICYRVRPASAPWLKTQKTHLFHEWQSSQMSQVGLDFLLLYHVLNNSLSFTERQGAI